MDALTSLMQTLDLNSKIISEGDYLKMCDSIKKIHDYIKYETDSESDGEEENQLLKPIFGNDNEKNDRESNDDEGKLYLFYHSFLSIIIH